MSILTEIEDERTRQDQKWGGPEHDDNQHTSAFMNFIDQRLKVIDSYFMVEKYVPNQTQGIRKKLIQIAALAVAAVESLDRKTPKEKYSDIVPCLGKVAYKQGKLINQNPFNIDNELVNHNNWIDDWLSAQSDDIPF